MIFLETFGVVCLGLLGVMSIAWFVDKLFNAVGGEYGEKVGAAAVFFVIAFVLSAMITGIRLLSGAIS